MAWWAEIQETGVVSADHDIAHRVKDAIRAAYPRIAEVLIHVEPHGDPTVAEDDRAASMIEA